MKGEEPAETRNPRAGLPSYIGCEGGAQADDAPRPGDLGSLEDGELLDLITQQDRKALEVLYDRYSKAVYSLAMHMLGDSGAAEEVTQDAFFNVWRRASTFRSERGKVSSWLFSIAHHRVIDEARRRRRHDKMQVYQEVELISQPADDTSDPTKYATLQMQRSAIMKALSALRPEQREVVMLAYYGGFTHSEIASRLAQPLGTVKTRMRLALKKLRSVMGPQAQEWAEHGL